MALTVGTDAFISLADADAYWSNHRDADSVWGSATDLAKEAAIREATEYLDTQFRWLGEIESTGQSLSWPRTGTDKEGRSFSGIPSRVEKATAILAREALSGYLLPAQERGGRIAAIQAGSVRVDYADAAPAETTYGMVNQVVSPLIQGSGINRKVYR